MYYQFSIFLLQGHSSVAELIFYARRLDQSRRTRVSSSGWSDHLADGLHRQLTGRTLRLSLLLCHQPVGWTARRSILCQPAGRILRRFIVSYAGDSLAFDFLVDLATSHRCAIKLLHAVRIRVLILGSMSGVLICT
jgi:hypothetical protein